eukprot:g17471.t1
MEGSGQHMKAPNKVALTEMNAKMQELRKDHKQGQVLSAKVAVGGHRAEAATRSKSSYAKIKSRRKKKAKITAEESTTTRAGVGTEKDQHHEGRQPSQSYVRDGAGAAHYQSRDSAAAENGDSSCCTCVCTSVTLGVLIVVVLGVAGAMVVYVQCCEEARSDGAASSRGDRRYWVTVAPHEQSSPGAEEGGGGCRGCCLECCAVLDDTGECGEACAACCAPATCLCGACCGGEEATGTGGNSEGKKKPRWLRNKEARESQPSSVQKENARNRRAEVTERAKGVREQERRGVFGDGNVLVMPDPSLYTARGDSVNRETWQPGESDFLPKKFTVSKQKSVSSASVSSASVSK